MKAKRNKSKRPVAAKAAAIPVNARLQRLRTMRLLALDTGKLALALAGLGAAYMASLFAIASGKTNLSVAFFSGDDHIMTWIMYRQSFVDASYPVSGFRSGVAPMIIPDMLGLFSIFQMGVHPIAANLILPMVYCAISISGWIAVVRHLYGASSTRYAFVLVLHAMPFLFVAAGPNDVHAIALVTFAHYGAWTCVPWLLFFALRTLDGGRHSVWAASTLAALLAFVAASDLVIVPWLVAPMGLILGLFALQHLRLPSPFSQAAQFPKGRLLMTVSAFAFGVPAGIMLNRALPLQPNRNVGAFLSADIPGLASNLATYMYQLAEIAVRNPFSASLWTLFAAIAAWRFWIVLTPKQAHAFSAAHMLLGVPAGASHAALALYFPIAAVLSVAGVVVTGNIGTYWIHNNLLGNLRHILPATCFPLFIGWALLPWKHDGLRKRANSISLVTAACATLLAVGLAAWSYAPLSKFNSFASPFHKCFAANARRLGWKGGIGTYPSNDLIANSAAGVERFVPVGVLRSRTQGESLLYLDWAAQNRYGFSGDFQFVVINGYKGRVFPETPHDENTASCPLSNHDMCIPSGHSSQIMDDSAALGAFGPPQAIVECYGLGFYHYDPPIRLDYTGVANPDLTRVGNPF